MMKVLVWADVHFDLWQRADTDPFAKVAEELASVDALIIAGDIADNPAQGWPGFFGYPHEVDPQHERSLLLRGMIEDGALGAV